jgi:hypothetical protein
VNTVNLAVDVFRMERGRYRPPAGRGMDLAAVLRRAAKNLASQAAAAGVEVAVQVDGAPLAQEAAVPAPGDPLLARALVERLLCDALHGCASGAALGPPSSAWSAGRRLRCRGRAFCPAGGAGLFRQAPAR